MCVKENNRSLAQRNTAMKQNLKRLPLETKIAFQRENQSLGFIETLHNQ